MANLDDEELAELYEEMSMGIFEDRQPASDKPPPVRYVGPYIPDWKTFEDEDIVMKFLREMQEIKTEGKIPRTIYFRTSKISREGVILIEFNQRIKVPPFADFRGNRRSLGTRLRLVDINV